MQANTKLNTWEKENLKGMRLEQTGAQVLNLDNCTTMVFQDMGNTVKFALSVMAPTEKKFRPKVGEYFARMRFGSDQTVAISHTDFAVMCECVWGAYPL